MTTKQVWLIIFASISFLFFITAAILLAASPKIFKDMDKAAVTWVLLLVVAFFGAMLTVKVCDMLLLTFQ